LGKLGKKYLKVLHQQAWESYRFEDNLRWSRFQTTSVVEGAFLYAAYVGNIEPFKALLITIIGSVLVLIISLLAIKDGIDADYFSNLAQRFEYEMGFKRELSGAWFIYFRGKYLMWVAIIIINLFNVLVVTDKCP